MSKRILIVEDEKNIVDILSFNLTREGYETLEAYDGQAGLQLALEQNPDLILLDLMLPKMDGFDVCRNLRKENRSTPVIMLTAREEETDKVLGLELGADDYITKPFSPSELLARVDAIYRRVSLSGGGKTADEIHSGPFILNLSSRTLTKSGNLIDLTQVEFQIMEFFMQNPNKALERSEILSNIWGENYMGDVKIVDVNIRRLRMKIEDEPSEPRYLTTVWGYGYKWNP